MKQQQLLRKNRSLSSNFIIAIDGVSASGKGTLAKLLAKHFGCDYLPTGNLYRLVALKAIGQNIAITDTNKLIKIARTLPLTEIEDPELSSDTVATYASQIAQNPQLRQVLSHLQRDWVAKQRIAIIEGRDIGSVICPDANIKLFLTASVESRAKRRFADLGTESSYEEIYSKLQSRDQRDSSRVTSPLVKAKDAILIDSTNMTIDEVLQRTLAIIDSIVSN